MAISETARRNHDGLFPNHVSALAITDPELTEIFDNFAFDEVLVHSRLDTRTRLMVQLAALIAVGAVTQYRVMLGGALAVGVTPGEAKEIVYQGSYTCSSTPPDPNSLPDGYGPSDGIGLLYGGPGPAGS